jgi:tRNA(fMet)-specific endonuclease VapC
MRPVLIDTNAYSALTRGNSSVVEIIQCAEIIGMSPVVIGELLFGFDGGSSSKKNRQELNRFLEVSRVKLYPITSDTAHFYSQICDALKRKGKPIPTNDIWIAAQALEHGCVVCTYDKHFEMIEGLIVVSSVEDLVV